MIEKIISNYDMVPHPEGGFYKETYRSEGNFNDRSYSTGIYFLLRTGDKSHLHRIQSDEMWHFYLGDPLKIVEIDEEGKLIETILGQDIENGEQLQYVVRAGHWFGSYPMRGSKYSFVGCTVSPGFDFKDFELAKKSDLLKKFPGLESTIDFLCLN